MKKAFLYVLSSLFFGIVFIDPNSVTTQDSPGGSCIFQKTMVPNPTRANTLDIYFKLKNSYQQTFSLYDSAYNYLGDSTVTFPVNFLTGPTAAFIANGSVPWPTYVMLSFAFPATAAFSNFTIDSVT